MPTYAHDTRLVFASNLLMLVAGVAAQALLAWFLLPQGRGEYAACVLFISLLVLVFALGQEMANVYYVGGGKLGPSEAMSQSLMFGGLASVAACVSGYVLTVWVPSLFEVARLSCFRLSLAWAPFYILNLYLSHVCLGLGDTLGYTLITALPKAVVATGLAVAAFAFRLSVTGALAIQIIAEAIVLVLSVVWLVRRHRCRIVGLDWGRLRQSLGYGVRFYVGRLCCAANDQIGSVLLAFAVQNAAMVGMFAAASAIFSRIWLLADTLQIAALPRTVADAQGRAEMVAQVVRLCLFCCGVLTLLAFALSKVIIVLVLSPQFLPVLVPVWILLPGILVRVIAKILPAYFAGTNRPQITSAVMAIAAVVNLALMYLLLPPLGLSGVALAMTVAFAVESLLLGLAFSQSSGLPVRDLVAFSRADGQILVRSLRQLLSRAFGERAISGGPNAP
ncbi:MAG: polysaccharide biosynthesis C-terminal domain-containing protein [Planctomycetota bacterium]